MLNNLDLTRYIRFFGLVAIFICISTWVIDWMQLVGPCPYCRSQRTIIGILGIMMLIPHIRYISIFFTLVFALFGIHVACAQIFMHIKNMSITLMFTGMAFSALCIMAGQTLLVFDRARQQESAS